jgi:hypothetical protein
MMVGMTERVISDADILATYDAFAATEHGQELAQRGRWQRFNVAGLETSEWENLLGADVNNLRHMHVSYGIARRFLQRYDGPAVDESLLKLAAITHDVGECIIGDIPFPDKTDADEAAERAAIQERMDVFFPGITDQTKEALTEAFETVVFDKESREGRLFNAIEHTGYLRMALIARRRAERLSDPTVRAGLRWLVTDVLIRQPIVLSMYADDYKPVHDFLSANRQTITQAYTDAVNEDFHLYEADIQLEHVGQFNEQRATWLQWHNAA